MAPKASNTRKKSVEKKKIEQYVLIRDETSELLMISESSKALPVKKGTQLATDVVVSWYDNNEQRWWGPILSIGSEAHCLKLMSTIEKNSNINNSENTTSKNQKEQPLQSTITIVPSTTIEQGPVDEEENNDLAEDDSVDDDNKLSENEIPNEEETGKEIAEKMNENDSPLIQTKNASVVSKRSNILKRSHEENSSSPTKKKKVSLSSLTVSYSTYSKMEQRCLAAEARIAYLEQHWMPRPKDPKVIQYFIDVTDILRGTHDNDDEEDAEEIMTNIMEELQMNAEELAACHKGTATATSRQIMRHIYPNPTDEAKERLDSDPFVKAVTKYTRISNPADPTEDSQIRHAMGNYIASIEFQNRRSKGVHS